MGLSARERVALHRLESQLTREDPALADHLASGRLPRAQLRRAGFLLRVLLPMFVGVQVAVVGGMAGIQPLNMLGLLYAVLAPGVALMADARRRLRRSRRRNPIQPKA